MTLRSVSLLFSTMHCLEILHCIAFLAPGVMTLIYLATKTSYIFRTENMNFAFVRSEGPMKSKQMFCGL